MRIPGLDSQALAPAFEQLFAQGHANEHEPLTGRERVSDGALGLALVAAALATAAVDGHWHVNAAAALALVPLYAVACRVRFYVGAGYTIPTQLALVPMLFAFPPGLVPLLVVAGATLGRLPDVVTHRSHPDRLLLGPANAWHALGPALVFAVADLGAPSWEHAPLYAAAFAAQILTDFVISTVREWLALGIPPSIQIALLLRVQMVDALLTPIGVMVAFAAHDSPFRALLVLPLIALFGVFAQERETNIANALQLSNAYRGTALLLGDVLEDKDAYTASHSHGVVALSLAVADRIRLDPAARRRVEFGALLHDIGKIAVPGEIINKPGPLDDDEWAVMKLHTVEGQQMLDRIGGVLGEVGRVVRSSHEHYDGSGYPDGLAGAAIPIEARIVSCCDAFSAMTTTRSYRQAMSTESAREELVRNSGTQFDPDVVNALLELMPSDHAVLARDAATTTWSAATVAPAAA
jgi:putative nucleotidyltransferase with HDIG domain